MKTNMSVAPSFSRYFTVVYASLFALLFISSCKSMVPNYDMAIPKPLVEPKYGTVPSPDIGAVVPVAEGERNESIQVEQEPRFSSVPAQSADADVTSALTKESSLKLKGKPSSLNVEGLPIPEFINEVFGNLLGLSFHLDPKISNLKDLVTVRIEAELSPDDLYLAAQGVLASYGISAKLEKDLLQFEYSPTGASSEPPLIISGNALPNVPSTHRPVFYLMDLKVVEAQQAVSWLSQAFEGQKVKFQSDPARNAVWLKGSLEVVKQAAEVVRLVDQPLMRGRNSIRIEPRFLGADKLAKRLVEMLKAQGYNATLGQNGTVNFFVIEETNSIIAFSTDPRMLSFVKSWVEELDKPLKQTKAETAFYYEVQRTSATSIAETMNQLGIKLSPSAASKPASSAAESGNTTESPTKGQLVVDAARNALLFYGTNDEWMSLLPTIEKLDKEALQVLIEVIVAEISLTDDLTQGVEWVANNINSGLFNGGKDTVASVAKSLSFTSAGVQYFPINSSGSTRATLSLLNKDSKIKVLQTPRILVRSGEEAQINVGTDIPIQAQTLTPPVAGSQTIALNQYRKTGNSLSVKPVVFAGGQVDLVINQEVSASDSADPKNLTPTISTRSISTALTIQDGGSVLVGGLINTKDTTGATKVPFLNKIPLIGKLLFSSSSHSTDRTELIILIAPYVIKNNSDAEAVTKAFKRTLSIENYQPAPGSAPKAP
jgi:general secretion pathway protein D